MTLRSHGGQGGIRTPVGVSQQISRNLIVSYKRGLYLYHFTE